MNQNMSEFVGKKSICHCLIEDVWSKSSIAFVLSSDLGGEL